MAVTNEQLIMEQRLKLYADGVIRGTGAPGVLMLGLEAVKLDDVPEQIHTFQAWKARGFSVRKGEKAVASFPVWKYMSKGKKGEQPADGEQGEQGEQSGGGFCRLKMSFFFSASQVEPIAAKS